MRDDNNKTPSDDPATLADRKSMFSDLSEEDEENEEDQHDIFPTVIIKNQEEEGGQVVESAALCGEESPRISFANAARH